MTESFDREEDELQHRQGGQLYPVGRSLRVTYPTPDGEELQPRITSLMVELSHQPYERDAVPCPRRSAEAPTPSMFHQLTRFFRRGS